MTVVLLVATISMPVPLAVFLIVAAAVLPLLPLPARDEEIKRKAALDAATDAWRDVQQQWLNESRGSAFETERGSLRRARDAYRDLEQQYARERGALEAAKRAKQLEQYLDRFFIDHARIPKVGAGRKATLASYGIETAADITVQRLGVVPGFGPTLIIKLLAWRMALEQQFTFDPAKEIDRQELARLDHRFAPRRRDLERTLLGGPARLNGIREQIEARRSRLRTEVQSRASAWARARADLDQMKIWR